jgi:hypothetical protein
VGRERVRQSVRGKGGEWRREREGKEEYIQVREGGGREGKSQEE